MKNKIKILIVDDSKSLIWSLKKIIINIANTLGINEKKFNIEMYYSVTDYLKHRNTNYDIAIIDWNLPDGKGKDVVKNLNGDCKYKAIYTGMVDDNIEIGKYCLENHIEYIPKGSNLINDFIENKLSIFK